MVKFNADDSLLAVQRYSISLVSVLYSNVIIKSPGVLATSLKRLALIFTFPPSIATFSLNISALPLLIDISRSSLDILVVILSYLSYSTIVLSPLHIQFPTFTIILSIFPPTPNTQHPPLILIHHINSFFIYF